MFLIVYGEEEVGEPLAGLGPYLNNTECTLLTASRSTKELCVVNGRGPSTLEARYNQLEVGRRVPYLVNLSQYILVASQRLASALDAAGHMVAHSRPIVIFVRIEPFLTDTRIKGHFHVGVIRACSRSVEARMHCVARNQKMLTLTLG